MNASSTKIRTTAIGAFALALMLSGCGGDSGSSSGGGGGGSTVAASKPLNGASFNVGAKEFTESKLLGQITAQVLQNAGATVKTSSLSGSATVREALVKSQIDMYWEYTGTGWVNVLKHTTSDIPPDLATKVAAEDKEKNKIAWLTPAPMNDTYRIAVSKDFGDKNNLKTTSNAADLVKKDASAGTVCVASEFKNRDDGLPGLQKAYGFTFGNVVELDLGLIYTQVGKQCNFGEVFSTDGRILANKLTVLEDDKKFFVDYNAALTMRQETLDKYAALSALMAPVSKALTNEEITKMNAAVDVDGKKESDVAEEWLKDKKLIG